MKNLLVLSVVVVLTYLQGCASHPYGRTSFGVESKYGFHNAGLVIVRTTSSDYSVATDSRAGFKAYFRNIETGEFFEIARGVMGVTDSQYFALWLPPGEYKLNGFFVQGGDVGPTEKPLMFNVQPGVMQYVGTLARSYDIPEDIKALGRPVSMNRNGYLVCPKLSLACDASSPGMSSNSRPSLPRVALLVFDEGVALIPALRKSIPTLPNREIVWSLMR